MAASSEQHAESPYRRLAKVAVASICQEVGFSHIEKDVMETLTEMLLSIMTEIGKSSCGYCEHSGRTIPGIGDVVMALINLGFVIESLPAFMKKHSNISSPSPGLQPVVSSQKLLAAGEKKKHPNYIPEHLPKFPDPHTYIQTPTHKQPVTEYEAIREKAASQKKDVERALTRFIAKTGNTDSLFLDEAATNLFPLIATKPEPLQYLNALIPKDQVFEEEELPKEKKPPKRNKKSEDEEVMLLDSEENQKSEVSDVEFIDNPYLRPCKVPKKIKR